MTTEDLIKEINPAKFNRDIPTIGAGTETSFDKRESHFIMETLKLAGMQSGVLKWIPYQTDYQGVLFFLKTKDFIGREAYLQEICQNVLGYGDCSYTLIKLYKGYYIIDMCS